MYFPSLAILVATLPITALGGEFPVYNGVVGGEPPNVAFYEKGPEFPPDDAVTRAGVLRYVENSGVCGDAPSPRAIRLACSSENRDNPWRVYCFRLRRHYFHTTHVVLVLCGPQRPRYRASDDLVERWGEPFHSLKPCYKDSNISKPGSSSMLGLFQEHGPCLINNDSSTIRMNPQSWNENSNMSVP